jgi:hypothetical protein
MGFQDLIHKVAETGRFGRHTESLIPPMLDEAVRFPYGPFRFKVRLPKGADYMILASTDLHTWSPLAKGTSDNGTLDYIDSEAFKYSYRFYRVQAGKLASTNVLGYASVTLPPGFSMIANPFDGPDNTISALFKGWPDGTTFNKFDVLSPRGKHHQVREVVQYHRKADAGRRRNLFQSHHRLQIGQFRR